MTTVILGTSLAVAYISQQLNKEDALVFFQKKYTFGEEYTGIIDDMIIKDPRAEVGSIHTELDRRIPSIGNHYFYYKSDMSFIEKYLYYVRFVKKREVIVDRIISTYTCYVGLLNQGTFDNALTYINNIDTDMVRTISIDLAPMIPRLLYTKKICGLPRPNQITALDHIIRNYTPDKNHNVKVVVTGMRGTGKTYIARLLKKRIQNMNLNPQLFDDFNPDSVGVNIQELILNKATNITPVIMVIDEIDITYNRVFAEKQLYDNRLQYTKDKQSFNNMLDVISDTKYVIAIYTTEKTIEQLQGNEEHLSFLRRGRVDFFLTMTDTECTMVEN